MRMPSSPSSPPTAISPTPPISAVPAAIPVGASPPTPPATPGWLAMPLATSPEPPAAAPPVPHSSPNSTLQKAREIVRSGDLGDIAFCRTFQAGTSKKEGWGNPPDTDPPKGLDWDLWLGPAPKHAFNANRWGVAEGRWSTFRYFWDYAGGAMTDWGVHLMDIVQFAY